MKIKINDKSFMIFGMIIILLDAYYWALSFYVVSYSFRLLLWIFAGFLPLILPIRDIKKNLAVVPWILYMLIVLLNRNQEFENGDFYYTFRLVMCLLFIVASIKGVEWIESAPKLIIGIGSVNVVATLLFFINSGLYETFISLTYEKYQSGTENGLYGYRAALADHYSQNGTYITVVILAVWAILLCSGVRDKKRKPLFIFGILSVLALLLTTKRAHLLFGIAAIIITYYVVNPNKRIEKTFKLMMAAVVALISINFLMDYIPDISEVFNRLQTAGTDAASLFRILMWQRAIELFNQHSFFGIGWYGFRYSSGLSELIGAGAGCHNIYLELLCETGIFGFAICIFAIVSSLIATIKNLDLVFRNEHFRNKKNALAVSFAIQIFVIMYGLTGNPLYDTTFYFYAIAVAINLAFTVNMRGKKYV